MSNICGHCTPPLCSEVQAREILGITKAKMDKLIADGTIQTVNYGSGRFRWILREELMNYVIKKRKKTREALEELMRLGEELGLYEEEFKHNTEPMSEEQKTSTKRELASTAHNWVIVEKYLDKGVTNVYVYGSWNVATEAVHKLEKKFSGRGYTFELRRAEIDGLEGGEDI